MIARHEKPASKRKPSARVPSNVERSLGQQLKTYYQDITEQEIPDRFLQLLQQLDEKTS
ncbi:MAG TPA: NepR family anti-sigma factor [Aestuariivirga sp.]|nr:NepR family anti-sigma factor [Aestuariivirga sp.]